METHEQIKEYFIGECLGSYLLYKDGLIPFEMINDIDIRVQETLRNGIFSFMKNNGWKKVGGGRCFQSYYCTEDAIFEKGREKPIHILFNDGSERPAKRDEKYNGILSIEEILLEKLKRGKSSDFEQVLFAVKRLKDRRELTK